MNDNNIITELQEISAAVANINRGNVYSVPPGYFNTLADNILQIVLLSEHQALNKTNLPYQAPNGYFENLSFEILKKVKGNVLNEVENELEEIAPFLNTISRKVPYSVPATYFETVQIEAPVQQAKVFSINWPKRLAQYAAAAAVTGIMAVSGYNYFSTQPSTEAAIATFNSQAVNALSDDEIIEYLNNNPSATEVSFTNKQVETEFEKYTRELSEEEIDNYLQENGEAVEVIDNEG